MIARYLGWRVTIMTCAILCSLVFFLWMGQSLRFMELLSVYRVPVGQFFILMGCMLPDLFGIVLPFSFALSVMLTIYVMIRDRELMILRSAGFSDARIVKGIAIAALVWGSIVWGIQGYGAPWALQKFKQEEAYLKGMTSKKIFRAQEHVTHNQITLHIGTREGAVCDDIFIHDTRASKPVTIVARQGFLESSPQKAILVLQNGTRQEWDPHTHQVTHLAFQHYRLELDTSSSSGPRILKPFELSLTELFNPSPHMDATYTHKMSLEGHQRILSAFYLWAMVFTSLAWVLNQPYERHTRHAHPLWSGLSILLTLQALYYGLIHLSLRWPWTLMMAYGVALLCIAIPWMMMTSCQGRFILFYKRTLRKVH